MRMERPKVTALLLAKEALSSDYPWVVFDGRMFCALLVVLS